MKTCLPQSKKVFLRVVLSGLLSSLFQGAVWLSQVQQQLQAVKDNAFPELEGQEIRLGQFSEADAFFQSNFEPLSLFTSQPVYVIEINPAVLNSHCPQAALEAILAHELAHTLDYHKGGPVGLLQIGWQMLSLEGLRQYEHRTDLQAIFRGYGPGLIAYRQWIYTQLTPEQQQRKQLIYYQPSEIQLLIDGLSRLSSQQRQQLQQQWLLNPPLNAEQIQAQFVRLG